MSRRHPKKKIKSKIIRWINFYGIALIIIVIPLFFVLKPYTVSEKELKNIEVTVSEKPEFIKERKSRNNWFSDDEYHINIKTVEFRKKFIIQNYTYHATRTDWVRGIKPNDKITLQILKEDYKELNEETLINNYNTLYGLVKDNKEYINLDLRSELKSKDMIILLTISLIGLIMLIYSFIKNPK